MLEGLGLEGSIPLSGFRLPESLELFSLADNLINGIVPEAWDPIPENFMLDLHGNDLSGEEASACTVVKTTWSLGLSCFSCPSALTVGVGSLRRSRPSQDCFCTKSGVNLPEKTNKGSKLLALPGPT